MTSLSLQVTEIDLTVTPNVITLDFGAIGPQGGKGDPGIGGLSVSIVETGQQLAVNIFYVCAGNALHILTLPVAATVGDRLLIKGQGAGLWRLQQNAGQLVRVNDDATTVGVSGRIDSLKRGDAIDLVCVVSSQVWEVVNISGNVEVI